MRANASRRHHRLAGKAFWETVTGNRQFYMKLVTFMRDDPDKHRPAFKEAWDRAENRFVRDFTEDLRAADGTILRDKLVKFNSGRERD